MSHAQTSSRVLPPNPSDEYLRKEAKRLAREDGQQLAGAQRRLAHEYGYRNWAELMNAVASMSSGENGGTNPWRPAGSPPISESSANVFPLLPLRRLVTFPHVSYPIFVGRAKSIRAVEHAMDRKLPIVLAAQKDAVNADPLSSDMYQVGALARVIQFVRAFLTEPSKLSSKPPDECALGSFSLMRIFQRRKPPKSRSPLSPNTKIESLVPLVISALVRKRAKTFGEENPEAWAVAAATADGASMLADRIASVLVMDLAWKQALLELLNPAERLEKLLVLFERVGLRGGERWKTSVQSGGNMRI